MPIKNCQFWIEQFKADFFARGRSQTTWETDYWKVLKLLPPKQPLTVPALHSLVLATEPNTKTRRRTTMVALQLAKFAKLPYDPRPYQGKYTPKKPQPRDIPSDQQILEFWQQMTNPGWKFIYGLIATYGLRPHETFLVDFDQLKKGNSILWVLDGKTGSRRVWAFHPEWFEQFDLAHPQLPDVVLNRRNDRMGHSATYYFRDIDLPWKLYDMRHRWAIRTLEYGLEDALSARQMGHSVEVHTSIYQHWIDAYVHQRAYDRLLGRPDRPKPPGFIL